MCCTCIWEKRGESEKRSLAVEGGEKGKVSNVSLSLSLLGKISFFSSKNETGSEGRGVMCVWAVKERGDFLEKRKFRSL